MHAGVMTRIAGLWRKRCGRLPLARRLPALALASLLAAGLPGLAAATGAGLENTASKPQGRPRIVTLAPNATELIYAAGAGADIVGTVRDSDYPAAARGLPRVGDGIQFSDETILALHPTLVVAWQPTARTAGLARRLQDVGVPLIYTDPQGLDDIPRLVRSLGARLGTQGPAEAAAARLEARLRDLHPPAGPAQTIFIEISAEPLYTLGRDPLVNDLLARCGGRNLYAQARVAAPQVSVEAVLELNPQVIVLSPYGQESLEARTQWWARHGLAAARAGHVFAIDADWLHRPGPRLVDAAEALCRDLRDSQKQRNGLS
jgi:iron complex transport system substrate-binding protein/vitamin B12 transport system substrate-binding protein